MSYGIMLLPKAKQDIVALKHSDLRAYAKFCKLLAELTEHPHTGTGKPERLRYALSGKWSRRITLAHRLIYEIDDANGIVKLHSVKGHYEDCPA